ncbi:hypothetical protein DSO57_1011588 [Entomophthora muscae]|uniref:Uncharacterized protein n=1 Tax=Entomophthora muscae TaxID=34485 RepID=A0ACC2TH45_9FUNG|nr:hypothetical protein DSO57_1011588 [Entomophthora muscae]
MFCESDMDLFHRMEIDATQYTGRSRTRQDSHLFDVCNSKYYLQDVVNEIMEFFTTQKVFSCVTEFLGDHPSLAGITTDITDEDHDLIGRVMYFLKSIKTAPFDPKKFRPQPEVSNPLDIHDPKDKVFALAYDFIERIYQKDYFYVQFLRTYSNKDLHKLDVNLGFHIKYWPFWFVYFYGGHSRIQNISY